MQVNEWSLVPSGSWHSHPDTRDSQPSSTDLRSWLGMLDYARERGHRQPVHVGLIVVARYDEDGYGSWAWPKVHGWVVHREGYGGTPVCDRAEIRWKG